MQPSSRGTPLVAVWAAIGLVYLLVELYTYARWLLNGNATPTPTGVTPVPASMQHWAIFWQVLLCLGSGCLFHAVVVKPWRRDGRLSVGGMLWFASQTLWFQDAFLNWFTPVFGRAQEPNDLLFCKSLFHTSNFLLR